MQTYLCQVCKKHTTEAISETFKIEAESVYSAVNKLEELSGIIIDGESNYMDWIIL